MKLATQARLAVAAVVLVGGSLLLPRAVRSQEPNWPQPSCWECINIGGLSERCLQMERGIPGATTCVDWIEYWDPAGPVWKCVATGICGQQLRQEAAGELPELSSSASAVVLAAEAAVSQSADNKTVWVLRGCSGTLLVAYVQIPGDRFVPLEP